MTHLPAYSNPIFVASTFLKRMVVEISCMDHPHKSNVYVGQDFAVLSQRSHNISVEWSREQSCKSRHDTPVFGYLTPTVWGAKEDNTFGSSDDRLEVLIIALTSLDESLRLMSRRRQ